MKISYIANIRLPTEKAHGIQVMQMCAAFSGWNNVEVELIAPRRLNKIKEGPFKYYGVERVFNITKLPCLDLVPLDKYIGHLALWIESLSFAFFVFFHLLFNKTDVIYTRDRFFLFMAMFWKNFVLEIHTFPRKYFIYAPFLKRIKKIIVITRGLKNLFLEKSINPEKILVAPDGVDIKLFDIQCSTSEARRKLGLPQDKKIVLYTGHLYEWKGAIVLLEAARKFLDTLFIFVGGPTKEDIKEFGVQCSNIRNVQIVNHRPHSEIPYWLKSADVLVLPNSGKEEISKYWTSPIKMFEYMVSKRPIVASNLPSICEILNERNAILVEPDNPERLAQGIKKLLQDPQLSDKISTKAFQDVQDYSWQKRVEKIFYSFNNL